MSDWLRYWNIQVAKLVGLQGITGLGSLFRFSTSPYYMPIPYRIMGDLKARQDNMTDGGWLQWKQVLEEEYNLIGTLRYVVYAFSSVCPISIWFDPE